MDRIAAKAVEQEVRATPGQIPVLECRNLSISYFTRSGEIPAVIDFNLKLMPGEAHGVVGESGCGKSTVALAIMQYLGRNGRIAGGQILFEGRDMTTMNEEELRRIRGSQIAMVYQEPMASLNPSMTIGDQLAEVPIFHEGISQAEALKRGRAMLESVRVPDPGPHHGLVPAPDLGGQQQRVVIAMALSPIPSCSFSTNRRRRWTVTVEAALSS
jgi:peptide/nickel transport system ATP-binding protein